MPKEMKRERRKARDTSWRSEVSCSLPSCCLAAVGAIAETHSLHLAGPQHPFCQHTLPQYLFPVVSSRSQSLYLLVLIILLVFLYISRNIESSARTTPNQKPTKQSCSCTYYKCRLREIRCRAVNADDGTPRLLECG